MKGLGNRILNYTVAFVFGLAIILIPALISQSAQSAYFLKFLPVLYFMAIFLSFYLRNKFFRLLLVFVIGQFVGYISAEIIYPTPFQNWIFPPVIGVPVHAIPLFILGIIGVSVSNSGNAKKIKMTFKKFILLFLCAIALPFLFYFFQYLDQLN